MANVPINSLVNLNLPAVAPDGFTDPEVRAAVEMFINAQTNLLRAFEQYTGVTQKDVTQWSSIVPSDTLLTHQLRRLYVVAGENLSNGDIVNLYNDAGVLKARRANATAGLVKRAMGYCSTTAGILLGNRGEVIVGSGILTITGVVPGDLLFLSTALGQATTVAPVGAGQLEQFIGIGIATNVAFLDITMGQYIQH